MSNAQPIATAPKDGTVILTDRGTACYKCFNFYPKPTPKDYRWYLCDETGEVPSCADDFYDISEIEPTMWMPFPKFVL
jgi:hypothetical protein